MACLTFFTCFVVSVFKASKTLKLMMVTHFQKLFKWPGAPKKEPKGQSHFMFCVSFFNLCPKGVQGEPRGCPRDPKRDPGGPKRNPREAKGDPKGVQGHPRGSPGTAQGTQKGSWGICSGHGGGKAAGSGIYPIFLRNPYHPYHPIPKYKPGPRTFGGERGLTRVSIPTCAWFCSDGRLKTIQLSGLLDKFI